MSNTSEKERMLSELEMSEYSAFPTYDKNGTNVGIVNREVVRRCIEAGHVFDLEHIPQSIVDDVCPIDWSEASFAPHKIPPYDIVRSADSIHFSRKRPWA